MKPPLARLFAVLLLAPVFFAWGFLSLGAMAAPGANLAATGLMIPFFNDAGTLTHRLTAERGSLTGPLQHLEGVELVYFSATDPTQVVRRLRTDEATWDQKREILAGSGAIRLESEDAELSGKGFHFVLEQAQLTFHRDFVLTNPEVVLTSDRAIADLVIDRNEEDVRVRDVKRVEALGNFHVTVQPAAQARYNFDEARSDRAIYDGTRHTITLPNEVRVRRGDREAVTQTLEISLGDRPTPGGRK